MSPSEADLRAALHEGDGEPDARSAAALADRIIQDTAVRRARRRTRLLTAAAAVLVVGGLGTGLGFITAANFGPAGSSGGTDSAGSAGSSAGSAGGAGGGFAGGGQVAGSGAAQAALAPPPTCPSRLTRYVASGSAAPGPSNGGGTLFALGAAIRSVVICAYSTDAAQRDAGPASATVTGPLARDLAKVELRSAVSPASCNRRIAYALVGQDTSGRTSTVPIIPVARSCNVVIGNRYQGPPPRGLTALLARLAPPVRLKPATSGVESGRPPR